ncbi:MAG: phage capsid protein [Magnetospiraceae bacterium]
MSLENNTAPVPVNEHNTAIAVAYKNPGYIADDVLPRADVDFENFTYLEYPVAETFSVTDDMVGRRSPPNEVEWTATEKPGMTEDHGLDEPVPSKDTANARRGADPLAKSTERLSEVIALNREIRTAWLVFNAANYPVGYKETLVGTDQFSDFANSDPLDVINTALDVPLMRPNIMVVGQEVWTKLKQHPDIIKSIHGNSGDKGNATRRAVAELFELEDVLVGQSRVNTAVKGQTAVLNRIWGKHMSLIYRNRLADSQGGISWGLTFQWGTPIATDRFDPDIGMRGGTRNRVGESLVEKIIAAQAGYFIENAVA